MKKILGFILFLLCTFLIVSAFILGKSTNYNYERYKIYMHPVVRADQYLLDSQTGNVWHLVEDKDKLLIWEPMPRYFPSYEDEETKADD